MKDETKDVDFNGRIMIKRVAREQKVEKSLRVIRISLQMLTRSTMR